jgi:hypothetical protein
MTADLHYEFEPNTKPAQHYIAGRVEEGMAPYRPNGRIRKQLRKLPYRWRSSFRYSRLGYLMRADKWCP